jgi:hypothetical protein
MLGVRYDVADTFGYMVIPFGILDAFGFGGEMPFHRNLEEGSDFQLLNTGQGVTMG